ncbi:hypothetical protein OESDEN_20414 [Oesophagostomum dentatum]|uniref:Beta-lactamase-related domain-containing protein n=1 Tax=Oesophagostomum dentatum TaxID=61180 RepID=A0A0B1S4Q9_OESDE|nr:hypothetical protein OESDEN_20414 [Oesophagostomum dentatum]
MHDRKIFSVGNLLHPKAQPSTGAKQQPMGEGKGRGSKESIIIQSIEMFNSPLVRAFGQPAVNGVASARGLALVHQKFMDGTLVSQEFFKNLSKPQFEDYFDHTLGEEESKGYGFTYCKSPTGTWQIGHPGVGSQCVRMDPENDLVICYLTNAVKASHGKHSSSYSNLHDKIYEIVAAKKKN